MILTIPIGDRPGNKAGNKTKYSNYDAFILRYEESKLGTNPCFPAFEAAGTKPSRYEVTVYLAVGSASPHPSDICT